MKNVYRQKITIFGVLAALLMFSRGLQAYATPLPAIDSASRAEEQEKVVVAESSEVRYFEELEDIASVFETDFMFLPQETLADSTQQERTIALEFQQEVTRKQSFISNLNNLSLLELPVGLTNGGSDPNYAIIISRARITPAGAFIDAYFVFEIPQTGDKIAFKAKNIKFSHEGGLVGEGRLELIGNYHIPLSSKSMLSIIGKGKTFVEFTCAGFKGMGLESELEFSRDMILPEDEKGKIKPAPARVTTRFEVYVQNWNDLLVGINLPAFQVKGLNGIGFTVTNAYLDWSDMVNPTGMAFPEGYVSPFTQAGSPLLWQGIFMQKLEMRLPPSFAKRQGNGRITLGVENMILDDQGFTGKIFAEKLLEDGDMNGWGYTLDRLSLDLVTNQVKGFELAGKLSIPVVKDKGGKPTQFGYVAQRSTNGDYLFAVSIQNELKLDLWAADLKLLKGSSIMVKERDDKFYPSATLNGELSVSALSKGPKASIGGIRFEQMVISSEAPHFKLGTVSFGSENKSSSVSGFPIAINNISVKSENNRIGLGFDLTINIGGKAEEGGFGGTAGLVVWGKEEKSNEWNFDKLELTGIGVKIVKPGTIEMEGMVHFFDADPTYGDGFKGSLKGKIQTITVQADALFGKTPTFRYWFADALVELESGIPMVPGIMSAYGFGGGYYSKMKQSTESTSAIGKTQSGITYVPDENTNGIRAIVLIGAVRKEAWNGDVALEVSINRHGGINSVSFTGNASFMTPPALGIDKIKQLAAAVPSGKIADKLASLLKGQVYGSVKLHFDNVNDVFHGNLEIFVNVAGGLVRGVSDGNKAGWAVIHIEKSDWYVHIGTPNQPLGLEVAKMFKSRSYFMLGKNLPGSPPPPRQVSEILGINDLDYMRDMNALESGLGFAFGLHFSVDTGDLKFLMFYARFAAGTGLDFMLKNYGSEYHCAGSSGSMGINGWYANGQAYAYVQGKIGIKVNLRFYKGTYDILNIGAAAILQAKGPNPFWMKGVVGGYYKILGGLVKGQCKFEMTIGKECTPVGEQNLLADVDIIAGITPQSGSADVDVFNTPQVAFNIPVGQVFEITDMENKTHYFRATLEEFAVYESAVKLQGTLEWNNDKDVVIFDGRDILPGEKKLQAKAILIFEERINGIWTAAKFDGKIVRENKSVSFTTGKEPDHIPPHNVAFSYPVKGQVNFYPKEYNQGFIQLKDGLPNLFKPGPEWNQKIRMTDAVTQRFIEATLSYSAADRRVNFTMPSGFENAKVYNFEILNIPNQRVNIDANVTKTETTLSSGSDTLTTKQVDGNVDRLDLKVIYSSNFRTSKYNTFGEKMRDTNFDYTVRLNVDILTYQLLAYLKGTESFDDAEVKGTSNNPPLLKMEAVLSQNSWYTNYVYPLVYEGYPLMKTFKFTRRSQPEMLGIPPVRDIYFDGFKTTLVLPDEASTFITPAFNYENMRYNLGESVNKDFYDLRHQAVNYIIDYPSAATQRLKDLVEKSVPYLRYGKYRIKIAYYVPGTDKATSSYELEMFNTVPDYE